MANESPSHDTFGPSSEAQQEPAGKGQEPPRKGQEAKGREAQTTGPQQQRSPQQGMERRQSGRDRGWESIMPSGIWGASPFSLMRRMMEDMDRMFEEYVPSRFGASSERAMERGRMQGGVWEPQVDVFERDGRLVVRADLPGMRKEDVRVEITDDAITLEGERQQEREFDEGGVYRAERSYGSFRREIPLPEGASAEQAEAHFDNGVLEISVKLEQERARSRRIEIQEGRKPSPSVH